MGTEISVTLRTDELIALKSVHDLKSAVEMVLEEVFSGEVKVINTGRTKYRGGDKKRHECVYSMVVNKL